MRSPFGAASNSEGGEFEPAIRWSLTSLLLTTTFEQSETEKRSRRATRLRLSWTVTAIDRVADFFQMDVKFIAHRGYSAIAPENTLAAIAAAVEARAAAVEFDVQFAADGVPVLMHDPTLDRTTNSLGRVEAFSLAQLQMLDAGAWFGDEFTGERIPSVLQVLEQLAPTSLEIYPEVKVGASFSQANVDRCVELLLSRGWASRCVLASFSDRFLAAVRAQTPQLALGFGIARREDYLPQLERAAADGNAQLLCAYDLLLASPDLLLQARERAVEVVAWTVDRETDLRSLLAIGVRCIITNTLLPGRTSKSH